MATVAAHAPVLVGSAVGVYVSDVLTNEALKSG